MRETRSNIETLSDKKSFPINGVMSYLGCGRNTAEKIGKAAGARFTVGRRVLYRRDKIDSYLDAIDTEKA